MSAVVRISLADRHAALLAGDIDEIALEHLLEENADVTAETLVFPHHGGRPGAGDPTVFASSLANAVAPELILFSTGRGKKNVNPHPAIVAALLQAAPSAHIGCTQLSTACSASTPLAGNHLSPLTAAGTESAKCCIGTVEINLATPKDFFPVLREHLEFVQNNAPTALCLNRGGSLPEYATTCKMPTNQANELRLNRTGAQFCVACQWYRTVVRCSARRWIMDNGFS
jgi:competence protein ComEC